MKSTRIVFAVLVLLGTANAAFKDTLNPDGLTWSLQADFGLVDDNAASNQSEKLQKAIDAVSEAGGGKLTIPKGTCRFSGIQMKSNVHLCIEKDTVIRPEWNHEGKTGIFSMGVPKGERGHIENVSIRGVGGRWVIDFSDRERREGEGIRA